MFDSDKQTDILLEEESARLRRIEEEEEKRKELKKLSRLIDRASHGEGMIGLIALTCIVAFFYRMLINAVGQAFLANFEPSLYLSFACPILAGYLLVQGRRWRTALGVLAAPFCLIFLKAFPLTATLFRMAEQSEVIGHLLSLVSWYFILFAMFSIGNRINTTRFRFFVILVTAIHGYLVLQSFSN